MAKESNSKRAVVYLLCIHIVYLLLVGIYHGILVSFRIQVVYHVPKRSLLVVLFTTMSH